LLNLEKEINLHSSVDKKVGVSGMKVWAFSAVYPGSGVLLFELFAPGTNEVVESRHVRVQVSREL
jgi:predicted secreted protein